MPSDYQRIANSLELLHAANSQPTLDELAAAVSLSTFHFQRLFRTWVGVSPKRYLSSLTAARAKVLLNQEHTVLNTAYDLGLSGSSRLHDLFVAIEAVTPGEYKSKGRGLTVTYGVHWTPLGQCLLAVTERGLCCVHFLADEQDPEAHLRAHWEHADIVCDPEVTGELSYAIFHTSDWSTEKFHLNLRGTNFQVQVWRALLEIPAGETRSYSELSEHMGLGATHARAVANAIGANPVAFLIPCHRVIRGSGALGGYRWGLDRKQALLDFERAKRP